MSDEKIVPNRADRRKKKYKPKATITTQPWLARADHARLRKWQDPDTRPNDDDYLGS